MKSQNQHPGNWIGVLILCEYRLQCWCFKLVTVVLFIRCLSDRGTNHGLTLAFLTVEHKYLSTLFGVVDVKVGEGQKNLSR